MGGSGLNYHVTPGSQNSGMGASVASSENSSNGSGAGAIVGQSDAFSFSFDKMVQDLMVRTDHITPTELRAEFMASASNDALGPNFNDIASLITVNTNTPQANPGNDALGLNFDDIARLMSHHADHSIS
jgi:hypothetical protein